MKYLIDSNILITAHKITHPIDIHKSFWKKLSIVLQKEEINSIKKVKEEIYYFEDDLKIWCKANIHNSFWKDTSSVMSEYAELQNWAQSQNYNERALSIFADARNADAFLIAFALHKNRVEASNYTIVTLETSAPDSIKNIKIPDVCNYFNIEVCNTNDLFRNLGISF